MAEEAPEVIGRANDGPTYKDNSWDIHGSAGKTLTRRQPKIKEVFDKRESALQVALEEAEKRLAKSQDPKSKYERMDPRWRVPQPDDVTVQPFLFMREGFLAIKGGAIDVANKTKKMGATAVAVTVTQSAFTPLMNCFQAFASDALLDAIDALRTKVNAADGYAIDMELLREAQAEVLATALNIDNDLITASKGDHDAIASLKDFMPSFCSEITAVALAIESALFAVRHVVSKPSLEMSMKHGAFLSAILEKTGAFSAATLGYVLSNSGMDKDTSVYRCSQFLASLKLMTEETYTGNLPVMQRALKLKRDLVDWDAPHKGVEAGK